MGRLVTSVREAEERLAGIGRALQTAYEEEAREATQARDSAARSLTRAEAMEQAARSLEQEDLTHRLAEIIQQLRTTHEAARTRLTELAAIERTVQMRLGDADDGPPTMSLLPAITITAKHERLTRPEPLRSMAQELSRESAPSIAPTRAPEDLKTREKHFAGRVDEIERGISRWPRDVARLALQEHVALARGLLKKLEGVGQLEGNEVTPALARLHHLAETLHITDLVGFGPDDQADWNKIATEARAQRVAIIDAKKKLSMTKPP